MYKRNCFDLEKRNLGRWFKMVRVLKRELWRSEEGGIREMKVFYFVEIKDIL